jgi:hypothetical protein
MASFGSPKHKQKSLEFAQQDVGTQSSFWVKINLDPTVKWEGLNKINVHKVQFIAFQWPYGVMFVIYEILPNKRKLKK